MSSDPPFKLFGDLEITSAKKWLVKRLLGAGEASTIYGKPGSSKSVLVEDLALHVAAGWDWHGRRVMQSSVLYVALERRQLVERRAMAFRQHYADQINLNLPFAVVGGVYDFRQPRTADSIVEMARQLEDRTGYGVGLIQVDTLSRGLCGGDENAPKDMGAIVATTARMQERVGAHIMWLHHTPIDGSERLRGHGALLGAMDTTIAVIKGAAVRTATVDKANDSEEGEQVVFTLESVVIGHDEDGTETTAPVVVPQDIDSSRVQQGRPHRKLSDRQRLALDAMTECLLNSGQPAPVSLKLPAGIQVVTIDHWREELLRRGVFSETDPNPRQDFKRIRNSLAARQAIGM